MSKKPARATHTLRLESDKGKPAGLQMAEALNGPATRAAVTLMELHDKGSFKRDDGTAPGIGDQMQALQERAKKIADGDMRLPEHTLAAQMQVLDGIFNLMAQRAMHNLGHSLEATERYMRMAMKAQSQCRASIEALAEVKHPRVAVFANQANVTSGPQQVNNGTPSTAPAHGATEQQANMTNELLEQQHGEWLDTRAPSQAGRGNQTLETVGEKHRTAHRRRQGSQ